MNSQHALLLLLIGVIVIVSLATYAGILLKQLSEKNKLREQQAKAIAQDKAERQIYVAKSLEVICSSLVTEQIEASEASIRICGLIDFLNPEQKPPQAQVEVFIEIRDRIEHIPQREAFQALPKKERVQHRKEIEQIEALYLEQCKTAAAKTIPLWQQLQASLEAELSTH